MSKTDISRRRILHLLGAGGTASVAGCSGSDDGDGANGAGGNGGDGTDTPTAAAELEGSAAVALPTDPTAAVWGVYGGVIPYYTNIVEPLVWTDRELKPQPWLATGWERTGEKTFLFELREDVTFHNGEPLTAESVVFSIEAILDEWVWAASAWHIESVEKVDDLTVEFTTPNVFPTFPAAIAHNMVAIQHPDRDREANEVIGTGPYQVDRIESGQVVETSAFENYWRGAPATASLDFRIITDANTRTLSLENDEVQVAFEPPRNSVSSLQSADATEVTKTQAPHATWIDFNMEDGPTDDVALRKALNFAVSQETIVEEVLDGIGQPARGPIAPSVFWSAHDELPDYGPDIDEARSLVEQSSYDGETLRFVVDSSEPVNGDLMAQVVQQNANEIGVDVEIRVLEPSAYDEAREQLDGHMFLRFGGTNSAGADYLLFDFFYSEGCCSYYLQIGEQFDQFVVEGSRTADPETKEEKYVEAQKLMLEQAAVIPMYYQEYVVASRSDIRDLDLYPIAEMSRWTSLEHLQDE